MLEHKRRKVDRTLILLKPGSEKCLFCVNWLIEGTLSDNESNVIRKMTIHNYTQLDNLFAA